MSRVPEHLKHVVERVRAATIQMPSHPWMLRGSFAVGGLADVGFARDSDLLLVISSQGRGVFDCLTGERIARDPAMPEGIDDDWQDCFNLEAIGIGPLEGQSIRISGLLGGGLPMLTFDGWNVERLALDWPDESLLLFKPGSSLYSTTSSFVKVAINSVIRAWGFSPTGRTLVLATSSDVTLFGRNL